MHPDKLFLIFVEKFNEYKIPYFVTGSVAAIVYGEPRLTHDIDIVLELSDKDVENFEKYFSTSEFYIPPQDILKIEKGRTSRGHFNLIHLETGFKADIYFMGKDKFSFWAYENLKEIKFHNVIINVAPPEYVIIRKLEYYKEGLSGKHLIDIKSMLEQSSDMIDFQFLHAKIMEFSLEEEWKLVGEE